MWHEPVQGNEDLKKKPWVLLCWVSWRVGSCIGMLKPFTSDWDWNWDLNSCAGTQTQPKLCLGLEPIRLGLKPSWNPAWDLNPFGWVSNSAKTHGTWSQDLRKLKFLLSHHRKNSVRDKVIGKKWIYSDSERSTLHRVWAIAEGECRHEMWPG